MPKISRLKNHSDVTRHDVLPFFLESVAMRGFIRIVFTYLALIRVARSVEGTRTAAQRDIQSNPPFSPPSWTPPSLSDHRSPLVRIGSVPVQLSSSRETLESPRHQTTRLFAPPRIPNIPALRRAGPATDSALMRHRAEARALEVTVTRTLKQYMISGANSRHYHERINGITNEAREDLQGVTGDDRTAQRRREQIMADAQHRADLPKELVWHSERETANAHRAFLVHRAELQVHVAALQRARALGIGEPEDESMIRRFGELERALSTRQPRPFPFAREKADVEGMTRSRSA